MPSLKHLESSVEGWQMKTDVVCTCSPTEKASTEHIEGQETQGRLFHFQSVVEMGFRNVLKQQLLFEFWRKNCLRYRVWDGGEMNAQALV